MKGFTLIELLAVIVILAVIALIATPIVLSIINDTKEQAVVRSAEFYVNAVENKIMQENMKLGGKLNPKECIVETDGNVTCDGTALEIEVNGDKPDSGSITFDRGRVIGITLTFGERKVVTNENGELILEDSQKLAPGLYYENDNLKISWADLTSTEYMTLTYCTYVGDKDMDGYQIEVNSPILSVDRNGILSGAYSDCDDINYSAEYLVGKLVIDESVTSIGTWAFNMGQLTSVIIPDSVKEIGASAFEGNQLTSLTIGRSVRYIGILAFKNNQLTSVVINGKSGPDDFYHFGGDEFGWADGYSNANITWQP